MNRLKLPVARATRLPGIRFAAELHRTKCDDAIGIQPRLGIYALAVYKGTRAATHVVYPQSALSHQQLRMLPRDAWVRNNQLTMWRAPHKMRTGAEPVNSPAAQPAQANDHFGPALRSMSSP